MTIFIIGLFIFSTLNVSAEIIDSDGDGIEDSRDYCPSTSINAIVDYNGCSHEQFCGQYICGNSCDLADWRNDEIGNPYDCRTVIISEEGRQFPKCIPIINQCVNEKVIDVPEGDIYGAVFKRNSDESYWNVTLSNIPNGFGPLNNTEYRGWCVDEILTLVSNILHPIKLYSSYDPELQTKCDYCHDEDWDKVNYLLNHKDPTATKEEIQEAVWYFVNGGHWPTSLKAQAMINDSIANGNGFVPSTGEYVMIIVDAGPNKQLTFIEVDP